jgi:hypothetical protein
MDDHEVQTSKSYGPIAPVFAGAAVVLVIVFLTNRGSDVGQIGNLLKAPAGSVFGGGIVSSIVGLLTALMIGAAWFGLGSLIASLVGSPKGGEDSRALDFAVRTTLGAAAWSFIFFFLGLAGFYHPSVAAVALVFGLAMAGFGFLRFRNSKRSATEGEESGTLNKILLALMAIPVVLALISSLAPPVAKDTLLYHFSLPKAFIADHRMLFVEGNMNSYMALGTEMHIVWAMLVGRLFDIQTSEAAAGAVIWLFLPLLLIAIYGWAREIGVSQLSALVATLLVATVPSIYHDSASGYIDVAWSLSIFLAAVFFSRWWREAARTSLVYFGIFLAAALAAKLLTIFVIAAFALLILLRARSSSSDEASISPARMLGGGFLALLGALALASPAYVRTWMQTGSPLFPYYLNVWSGSAPGWDVERSELLQLMSAQYGGLDKSILDYLLLPWNLSIKAQPEIAQNFDGVLGVAFLLGLPLLIWALWKFEVRVEANICAAIAGVFFLFWLSSSPQMRYLLPALPLLAIALAASIDTVGSRIEGFRKAAALGLAAASAAGVLVTFAWFLQKAPVRVVLGGESREAFVARSLDYYLYYEWLNGEAGAGANVWLINMRRDTYYLDRPYFSDYMLEDVTLQRMVKDIRSVAELRAQAAAMGINYVLARHDFLLDPRVSSLVDDRKSPAENEAKLKIAREFLMDPARTVKADGKFSLVKVF